MFWATRMSWSCAEYADAFDRHGTAPCAPALRERAAVENLPPTTTSEKTETFAPHVTAGLRTTKTGPSAIRTRCDRAQHRPHAFDALQALAFASNCRSVRSLALSSCSHAGGATGCQVLGGHDARPSKEQDDRVHWRLDQQSRVPGFPLRDRQGGLHHTQGGLDLRRRLWYNLHGRSHNLLETATLSEHLPFRSRTNAHSESMLWTALSLPAAAEFRHQRTWPFHLPWPQLKNHEEMPTASKSIKARLDEYWHALNRCFYNLPPGSRFTHLPPADVGPLSGSSHLACSLAPEPPCRVPETPQVQAQARDDAGGLVARGTAAAAGGGERD